MIIIHINKAIEKIVAGCRTEMFSGTSHRLLTVYAPRNRPSIHIFLFDSYAIIAYFDGKMA